MTRQKGKHRKRSPGWHTSGSGPARAFTAAAAMFAGLEPTGVDWSAEVYPTREEAEREAQRARQSVHVHDWRAVAVLEPAELDRLLTAAGINPAEIAAAAA